MPARSLTCPSSGGTSRPAAKRTATRRNTLELHLGRILLARRALEGRTLVHAAHAGADARGEALDDLVVLRHRLDVAAACYGDAVLGALELRLQIAEGVAGAQ